MHRIWRVLSNINCLKICSILYIMSKRHTQLKTIETENKRIWPKIVPKPYFVNLQSYWKNTYQYFKTSIDSNNQAFELWCYWRLWKSSSDITQIGQNITSRIIKSCQSILVLNFAIRWLAIYLLKSKVSTQFINIKKPVSYRWGLSFRCRWILFQKV